MQRRKLLQLMAAGVTSLAGGAAGLHLISDLHPENDVDGISDGFFLEDIDASYGDMVRAIKLMSTRAPDREEFLAAFGDTSPEEPVLAKTDSPDRAGYLSKMLNFDASGREDVYLGAERYPVLVSTYNRLDRIQKLVGHGNFNVISFDEVLRYTKNYARVGQFTPAEMSFIEELFATQASGYGFYGDKVVDSLTATITEKDRLKVRGTGHYLYRGESENLYSQIRKDVGESIVLTSGIRSVVKQIHLFAAKTIQSEGNLSRASRSLAPPGHSYHGIGDFDVGIQGFGRSNFTEAFAATDEFRKLVELGYVEIRYPKENLFGVRYEPWHIKVV